MRKSGCFLLTMEQLKGMSSNFQEIFKIIHYNLFFVFKKIYKQRCKAVSETHIFFTRDEGNWQKILDSLKLPI